MASAKDIRVAPISSSDASNLIRRIHYSGKVVNNSQLHFGVFLNGRAEGAMQFGPPLDKSKVLGLVSGTPWTGMLELNRMAFGAALPRNSESRALGVVFRIIRKRYPQIQWVLSFADGTQCGDGTIYRAAGFVLTAIKRSDNLARLPSGVVIHKMTLESAPNRPRPELGGRSYFQATGGKYNFRKYCADLRAEVLPGFQLRYVYFLDPSARARLTVPVVPFERIKEVGASMYLGKQRGVSSGAASGHHPEEGGSTPTTPLQLPPTVEAES